MFDPGPRFSHVIFDMDGVLLDTERLYEVAMGAACAALGYEMTPVLYRAQIGVPLDQCEMIVGKAFGPDFPMQDYYALTRNEMAQLLVDEVPTRPGALRLLQHLHAIGIPTAVATSTSSPTAEEHLERAGLRDWLGPVVTRSHVERGKPHPEPYLLATEKLGASANTTLGIEDSHTGVRAAHAAGLFTVMVPDQLPPTDEISALCGAVLPDLAAVGARFFGLTEPA